MASAARVLFSLNNKPVATVPAPRLASSTAVLRPEIRRVKVLAIFVRWFVKSLSEAKELERKKKKERKDNLINETLCKCPRSRKLAR